MLPIAGNITTTARRVLAVAALAPNTDKVTKTTVSEVGYKFLELRFSFIVSLVGLLLFC